MKKFFLFFISSVILVIIFITYFGIETNKFDALIKNKVNNINQYTKLDFNNTKLYLNPVKLNLLVKLKNPKILIKENEILLSKLDLFLSVKSFFTSDFLLEKAEIAFSKNDIKDLTKITNIFLPKIINNQLNKFFLKGSLQGQFVIPFESNGSISENYGFTGKVTNAYINLTKEISIKNLTSEIKHKKKNNINIFDINIKNGSIYDLDLKNSTINLVRENNIVKVDTRLNTKGQIDFSQTKRILNLFSVNKFNVENINSSIDLKTNIKFEISKKFKIKKLIFVSEGNIDSLEIGIKDKKIFKDFLPEFDSKVVIKNTSVKIKKSTSDYSVELNGSIKAKDNFDTFELNNIYDYKNKTFNINGNLDLTNSKVKIDSLNYLKDNGVKSELNFNTNFIIDNFYNINNLNLSAGENKIILSKIKINKNLEVEDFEKIIVKTFDKNDKNNDFLINKLDEIIISGERFDAQPLLKSLYKNNKKGILSKKLSTQIKVNIDKALTGTDDDIFNFSMIATYDKGSYSKLSMKGNFSENEIIEMSIYQVNEDKKTLQVISDRARPFIKNFEFIEGFEGGKLNYESTILNKATNSNLIITDFKVSKVPALAKLLTLASLQGIADTLSGEGIRFESFEMKTNTVGNVLNIEDALAMGPAVSILLEGYVDKGNIVSLRGTLVPATKLNSIIASIPLVGDILVGKKTGDGVVGVSFKMKGPPKNIKTAVNPIKTLTPRFIVRAVENMKKRKEKTK